MDCCTDRARPVILPVAANSPAGQVAVVPSPDSIYRFGFVDNLRGFAAMAVVLYHLVPWNSAALHGTPLGPFCGLISIVAQFGGHGVTIFFVISGFVIAHSLRGARVTPQLCGNFVLRRAIRLDPPYWVSILVGLAAQFGLVLAGGGWAVSKPHFPSLGEIAGHLTYTQYFFRQHVICDVYWTLCLEVQFYLLFILILGVGQFLFGRSSSGASKPAAWILFFPLGLVCLLNASKILDIPEPELNDHVYWFTGHFHAFLLGAFVAWCGSEAWCRRLFLAFVGCFCVTLLAGPSRFALATAVCTALVVFVLVPRPKLAKRFESRVFAYLGKISYSLYLIHMPVGLSVRAIIRHAAPDSPLLQDIAVLAAIAASIVAADIMYRLVEVRTVEFARRLKRPSSSALPTRHAEPQRLAAPGLAA